MPTPELGSTSQPQKPNSALQQAAAKARHALTQLANLDITQPSPCLTPNGAEAMAQTIQAFPWRPGDGIVISATEQRPVLRAVRHMARDRGMQFYIVPYTDAVPFDIDAFENLLQTYSGIRLVATQHASPVIGTVNPAEAIGDLARQYSINYWLDISQTLGHLPLDTQQFQASRLFWSGNANLPAPPGWDSLAVTTCLSADKRSEQTPLSATTLNHLAQAIARLQIKGLPTIQAQESALLTHLLDGLSAIPEVVVYGQTEATHKIPVVSFNVLNQHPQSLAEQLPSARHLWLEAGFHGSPMAHEAIGTTHRGGTVRVQINHETTPKTINAMLQALKAIIYGVPERPAANFR